MRQNGGIQPSITTAVEAGNGHRIEIGRRTGSGTTKSTVDRSPARVEVGAATGRITDVDAIPPSPCQIAAMTRTAIVAAGIAAAKSAAPTRTTAKSRSRLA